MLYLLTVNFDLANVHITEFLKAENPFTLLIIMKLIEAGMLTTVSLSGGSPNFRNASANSPTVKLTQCVGEPGPHTSLLHVGRGWGSGLGQRGLRQTANGVSVCTPVR